MTQDNAIMLLPDNQNQIPAGYARLEVTFDGQHGTLRDPVARDAADGDVKQYLSEAIANGEIAGIRAQDADLRDFVVDRFEPTADRPHVLIMVRPKTPFGTL